MIIITILILILVLIDIAEVAAVAMPVAATALPVIDTAMPVITAGSAQKVERLAKNLQLIACAIRFMEFGSTSDPTTGRFHFFFTTQALDFLCGIVLSALQ